MVLEFYESENVPTADTNGGSEKENIKALRAKVNGTILSRK